MLAESAFLLSSLKLQSGRIYSEYQHCLPLKEYVLGINNVLIKLKEVIDTIFHRL